MASPLRSFDHVVPLMLGVALRGGPIVSAVGAEASGEPRGR
jgi:hypothetical protein